MAIRNYKCKDVELLSASKTIAQSLLTYINELSIVRINWNADYATALSSQIDLAIDTYLGLDKKKELRQATSSLMEILTPALRDLSFLKTQIEVDFKDESDELLMQLGFTSYLNDARKGNQESLIQLLYTFKNNMSEALQAYIVDKGTSPLLIERITAYADSMLEANVSQETMKETTKALSEEAINALNEIYSEIIGVCKIAASYYQYEPIKKEQFTFSKIVSQMSTKKT